jgi:hypothetical protein
MSNAQTKRDLTTEIAREAARLAALQKLAEVADQVPELVAKVESATRETERAERAARRAAEQLAAAKAAELEARKAVRALVGSTGVTPSAAAAFLGIAPGLCIPLAESAESEGNGDGSNADEPADESGGHEAADPDATTEGEQWAI